MRWISVSTLVVSLLCVWQMWHMTHIAPSFSSSCSSSSSFSSSHICDIYWTERTWQLCSLVTKLSQWWLLQFSTTTTKLGTTVTLWHSSLTLTTIYVAIRGGVKQIRKKLDIVPRQGMFDASPNLSFIFLGWGWFWVNKLPQPKMWRNPFFYSSPQFCLDLYEEIYASERKYLI